jgi:hypothetical protein
MRVNSAKDSKKRSSPQSPLNLGDKGLIYGVMAQTPFLGCIPFSHRGRGWTMFPAQAFMILWTVNCERAYARERAVHVIEPLPILS